MFKLLILTLFITMINAENIKFQEITRVYDGDTFYVNLECTPNFSTPAIFCRNIPVRVWGIDTPEMKSSNIAEKIAAVDSRNFTEEFLRNTNIELEDCQRDKYFRILCKVKNSDGKYLHDELIKRSLGKPYFGAKKEEF